MNLYTIKIYNIDALDLSSPHLPGRVMGGCQNRNTGTWLGCVNWAHEMAKVLPVGKYVAVAASHDVQESTQGVWVFTVRATYEVDVQGGI